MLVRRIGLAAGTERQEDREIGHFRIQQFNPNSNASFRSSSGVLNPVMKAAPANQAGDAGYLYEADFDLSTVPSGENFEVGFEVTTSGIQGREDQMPRLKSPIVSPTDWQRCGSCFHPGCPIAMWRWLPISRTSQVWWRQSNQPTGLTWPLEPLFGGMMVAPLPNHTYECRWTWDDDCNALTHGADSPGRSLAVNSIRMTEPAPIAKPGNWEERPHRNKKTPRNSSFPELDTAKSYPTRTRISTKNTGNFKTKSANDAQDDAATLESRLIQAFGRLSPDEQERLIEHAENVANQCREQVVADCGRRNAQQDVRNRR